MSLTDLLGFHGEVDQLKKTIRYSDYKGPVQESTADHSWGLTFLVLDTINELGLNVDPTYSIKLALCHDLAEYPDSSDICSIAVARGHVSKGDKHEQEERVMRELSERHNRQDIYDTWTDYEEGRTPEARLVKAMDKIEALVHMTEIGIIGEGDEADHTALYADKAVSAFPELIPLLRQAKTRLKAVYQRQNLEWKPEYDNV